MVTITFSGDAYEVLGDMKQFVNPETWAEKEDTENKKPMTPLAALFSARLQQATRNKAEEAPKQDAVPKEEPKTPEVLKQDADPKEEHKAKEAPKQDTVPKKESPKAKEAPKQDATPKEEPKQEASEDAPLSDDQKAELRTLCMTYCRKVPDGKDHIKQLLKDKGCAKVTDLKQKDVAEFKSLVQI